MPSNSLVTVPLSSGDSPGSRLDNTVTNEAFERLNKKYLRLIVSGNNLEAYWTPQPVLTHRVLLKPPKPRNKKVEGVVLDRSEEYKERSVNRAKNKARRLAQANFDPVNSKLLTLTFAPTDKFDVRSPDDCHPKFKNFMAKLKRRYPKFKYIATGEFQTKNERMAVHYHLLVNLPYVKWDKLTKLWGYGGIDVEIGDSNPLHKISYITKYITKDNSYVYKNHRYFASKGLKKPITLYGYSAESTLARAIELGFIPIYESTYANAYVGETNCIAYNLFKPAKEKLL